MHINKTHLAILALILANTIWGASAPILKWSLQDIQPFTLAFLRFILASLIIFPFTLHRLTIKRQDWIILLFIAIMGMGFHIAYFLVGLKLTSSINAPIIGSAGPIFLIIGAIFFLHEKPQKKMIRGTLISLIGVMIIVIRPLFEQGLHSSIIGNVFFIVSMILSVIYTLLLKEIASKYHILTLTFWIFAITAIFFAPFALYERSQSLIPLNIDSKAAIGILFGGICSSAIAYLVYTFAVKHISANQIGIFSYTDPIIAIVIAKLLLGENMTLSFLIGTVLVFVGIFTAEGRLHYHPIHLLWKKPNPSPTLAPEPLITPPSLPINTSLREEHDSARRGNPLHTEN